MDLLKRFVEYLGSQKNSASKATIKNYRADVAQFIRWFEEEFKKTFNPDDITPQIINLSPKKLSPRSLERHMSSLRKFFHFLKIESIISKNPFEEISNFSKNASSDKDKWHLTQFKNYLYANNLSHLTIKNYLIDLEQFFGWLELVTEINKAWDIREGNVFEKINPRLINEYKERLLDQRLSPKTINRKLSSLRKYLGFAKEQGLISEYSENSANQKIRSSEQSESQKVAQSDLSDSRTIRPSESSEFSEETYSRFPPLRLLQKTTKGIIFIFDSLLVIPLAKSIEQSKYIFWKIKGRPIFKDVLNISRRSPDQMSNTNSKIGNWKLEIGNYSKAMYAPLSISTASFPLPKKLWHHVRHTRPKWYKRYHQYPIVHYFHFAILFLCVSAIGFALYNDFIFHVQNKTVLSAQDSQQPRILAFKGRLTDSLDNPITKPNTPLRISLYNDPIASGHNLLWQEAVSVNPNQDGFFETTVGKSVPIPENIFQNPSLWLGISIDQTEELFPRQELATASLAVNSQTLQGMPAVTDKDAGTRNVILALDSSGNLSIGGEATPVFQAVGGQFTLSGKVLLLTTIQGSDSDVVISPEGLGKIDLQKPLQNTSDNNNIASAIGAVEVDDLFAVLATGSGQSALTINQDGNGPIISASTSGTAKFTVENNGNIVSAQGVNWQPTFDSANGLNIASASGIPFVTFDTLHQSVGIGTVIPEASLDVLGGFRATGNITLSKFISNGGIIYATKSGSLAQVSAGLSTQCLMGGETPKFANCASSPYNNITEANGNIGIGTATPLFKLDIQNSQLATAAAQIFNTSTSADADGLIIKLGNASTSEVNTNNHFISFETSGIGIVGSIQGKGTKGIQIVSNDIADFAEYLKKDQNQTIEYGSVVCINEKGLVLPCDKDNTNIVGVASEHSSFLGGENLGNKSVAVGLTGQVYARVSNLNGDIKPGYLLTYSSIPGVAIKAVKAGQIIGKALEGFNSKESQQCYNQKTASDEAVYGGSEPVRGSDLSSNTTIAKAEENVNSQINGSGPEGNRTPGTRLDRSDPNQSGPTPSSLCSKILTLVNVSWYDPDVYLTNTGNLSIVNQESGIKNQAVALSSSIIHDSLFMIQTTAGQLIERIGAFAEIAVANLKAGFIKAEEINTQKIISPIAEVDEIHTNVISPLASDSLRIHLSSESSKLIVENASGSSVATIDSSGNASFSGTLSSAAVETNNATVLGTLRAGRIVANNIEALEGQIASFAAQTIDANTQLNSVGNLNALSGTFTTGLMSFGPTSLAETSIAGSLYIQGTLILAANSINVLGHDLELQPLRQGGISFLSGLIQIDKDGNVKVLGNAEFAKNVSIKGDLVASGSATFAKLNLSLVQPALAISQTQIIATGSAGLAAIKAYQTELTIINKLITDKSLIYITPVGTPSATTPFLMRQTLNEPALSEVQGSFTVGIQSPAPLDTLFNWLIVN